MKIVYIVSRYPQISETFIAREMTQLIEFGWQISVCRLRPFTNTKDHTIENSNPIISPFFVNPIRWINGIHWAKKVKPNELKIIWDSFRNSKGNYITNLKLLVIFLSVLGMGIYLQKQKILHIRAHFLHSEAISAYWLSILLGIPYSLTIHTRMVYFPKLLMQEVLKYSSFIVGSTNDVLQFVHDLNENTSNTYLIRNGIQMDDFSPNVNIRKSEIPVIIAVGRLVKKKGFDILIKACVLLQNKGVNFVCYIVGSGSEYHFLKHLTIENGLARTVLFLGSLSISDLLNEYQLATILVAPSRVCRNDIDGLPTVIIEALASGLPVIATPVAGIPELVIHNETGILFPIGDETELSRAIENLFENKSLYHHLCESGRKKVVQEYNIYNSGKIINELIQKAIIR
jgi:colanic acid/amylovoran biosynthesis glycosyltransferase